MTVDRSRLLAPALDVAPRLIGAVVVSELGGERVAVRLSEVEAYEGLDDPASHAFRGLTPRTAVMFGPPGHLYCYFTYGMHWCANIVCRPDGTAGAVLLRAGAVVEGVDVALARRPASRAERDLARGPARLATCLGLDRDANGIDLCDPAAPVRLESMPARRRPGVVERAAGGHHRRGRAAVAVLARRRPDRVGLQGGRPTAPRHRFGRLTP